MVKEYHFRDIEKYLKKDTDRGAEVFDAINTLADVAIIFGPIIGGAQFLPLLGLLDVKDRILSLGRTVFNSITSRVEKDYIDRAEQIRAAYALISFTAYFDVFQDAIPKDIRKKLNLSLQKKSEIFADSIKEPGKKQLPPTSFDIRCNVYYADQVTSFAEIKNALEEVYDNISRNLLGFIKKTKIFNEEKEKDCEKLQHLGAELEKLPKKAIQIYEAQYIDLAVKFQDFAIFAQLQNFEGLSSSIAKNQTAIKMLMESTNKIDVGMNNLKSLVNSLPTSYNAILSQDIVDDLGTKYNSIVNEPIIDSQEIKSAEETLRIQFPTIGRAFIPQSFKCLTYTDKTTKLEDETIWKKRPRRNDLGKFIVSYLSSPDSIDYPLIILGQPGSGKSLLTKMLSARLMSDSYTVIRIPLRDVNAESGIDVLVEDQIKSITSRPLSTQGYGGFAAQFKEKPILIILDGYDELLQAKGDIYSGYLEKVRTFQQDQISLRRPVRVIITSRITLIDKARIPENATVLRLLEFDAKQRNTWIEIWNEINKDYFVEKGITPFRLAEREKGKKNSIIELAEQPLLLLMLALYDSDSNELADTSNMKRTDLYDSLLRRFVRRERGRYVPGFENKTAQEREAIVDDEMNRLGVVAIGMYNRKEVVIKSSQLEADLDAFSAHRNDGGPRAHTLKESDSVLGGFFFIHKSTAQDVEEHSLNSESAYEFLHNTFGEFLAADFILRNTINAVKRIHVNKLYGTYSSNGNSGLELLDCGWFYCLMLVPLYSRPVVIEMLREHLAKAMNRVNPTVVFSEEDFVKSILSVVKSQLNMVLHSRDIPKFMQGEVFDQNMPLLGYLATYSLNLVILASALCPDGFQFDEKEYVQEEASLLDSRPWEKITLLWRAWFPPADLMGLSVILNTDRSAEGIVTVKCNKKFEATRYEQPIDILLCVSSTLADSFLTGLSGLHSSRFSEITRMNNDKICRLLKSENLDFYYAFIDSQIWKGISDIIKSLDRVKGVADSWDYGAINDLLEMVFLEDSFYSANEESKVKLLGTLEYCLRLKLVYISLWQRILRGWAQNYEKLFRNSDGGSNVACQKVIRRMIKLFPAGIGFRLIDTIRRFTERPAFYEEEFERSPYSILIEQSGLGETNNHLMSGILSARDLRGSEFDQEVFLSKRFQIMMKTDPEEVSNIILLNLRDRRKSHFRMDELLDDLIEDFLLMCTSELADLSFQTISNAIEIATKRQEYSYTEKLKERLSEFLWQERGLFYPTFILHPRFIVKIIQTMPEVLAGAPPFERAERLSRLWRKVSNRWLEYIEVLRCMNERQIYSSLFHSLMSMRDEFLPDLAGISSKELAALSYNQLSNLFWYASEINDRATMSKVSRLIAIRPEV